MPYDAGSDVARSPPRNASFLTLPSELILQCLEHLSPLDLISVSETCRSLYKTSATDLLWQTHINDNLAASITSPYPLQSFKDLYVAHHAYWFVTRNRIWISDIEPYGKLILSRFNAISGAIEAHTVVAERGPHTVSRWSEDHNVLVHGFDPRIAIHQEAPVLKLSIGAPRIENLRPQLGIKLWTDFMSSPPSRTPPLAQEILMDCATSHSPGLKSAFFLANDLPPVAISSGTAVWPPLCIPAPARTRNLSASDFSSIGHRPSRLSEVSQSTFRVRKWVDYHDRVPTAADLTDINRVGAVPALSQFTNALPRSITGDRRGDQVTTFGTIDPYAYTPTARKPYRGIYCGDYSGHGCEFLLVLQPDEGQEYTLPDGLNWLNEWLAGGRTQSQQQTRSSLAVSTYNRMHQILTVMAHRDGFRRRDPRIMGRANMDQTNAMQAENDNHDDDDDDNANSESGDDAWPESENEQDVIPRPAADAISSDDDAHSGQLIAIKLTGDPHIPRGHITFIAPDIGEKGFMRIANDDTFRGSRVVRSAGHVANRGFIHDEYIPSQLILSSHDCLAQYWHGFGHISFYKRVDLSALLAQQ